MPASEVFGPLMDKALRSAGERHEHCVATDLFLMTPDQVVETLYKHPEPVKAAMPAEPDNLVQLVGQRGAAALLVGHDCVKKLTLPLDSRTA
jgi:hypothetical protein